MLTICNRFKREIDYDPVRFRQMVVEQGGPTAARHLLSSSQPQIGLETLNWRGRLAESVEAHVLLPYYSPLFTDEDRRIARQRLSDLDFDVDAFLVTRQPAPTRT
jgi:hypothetical protein